MYPVGEVLSSPIAYFQQVFLTGHAQRHVQTAGQVLGAIGTEGGDIVKAKERALAKNGRGTELGIVVGQLVVKPLIGVTYQVFDDIIILDSVINKGFNLIH